MNDNFTMKEAVELILGVCKDPQGYWKSEIEESPEAKKFIEAGYTCFSEDNPDLYVLNSNGEVALHEYIEEISKEFIEFMQKQMNMRCPVDEVVEWFNQKYNLEDMKLSDEISRYICSNLHNYGYTIADSHSSRSGSKYTLQKM